jgi:hypothetical protein
MISFRVSKVIEAEFAADIKSGTNIGAFALVDVAMDIDRITDSILSNAEHIAERFTDFARSVREGRHLQVPTGWSSLQEIGPETGTLKSKWEELRRLVTVLHGEARAKEIDTKIKEARKAWNDKVAA